MKKITDLAQGFATSQPIHTEPTDKGGLRSTSLIQINVASILPRECFTEHDAIVKSALNSFRTIGAALEIIKTEKLWTGHFRNWTAYCNRRIGSTEHARRSILEAQIDSVITSYAASHRGVIKHLPTNKYQMRPLIKNMVDTDRILAWELAIKLAGGEDPTPKHVKKAVQEVLGETPEPKPDKKAELRKKLELLMAMVIRRDSERDCVTLEKIKSEFQALLSVI